MSTSPTGRLRMWASPSKATRPVESPATGGTNRITVPARPQSTSASRSKLPGVTVQSSPEVSTAEPRAVRAEAISAVSRERRARRTTEGRSAIAASTSARLVRDLEPGSVIVRSTGEVARGAGQCSGSVTGRTLVGGDQDQSAALLAPVPGSSSKSSALTCEVQATLLAAEAHLEVHVTALAGEAGEVAAVGVAADLLAGLGAASRRRWR